MRTDRNRRAASARGFTLIEIMVVVAIMAIVLTIGVPFMRNAIDSPKGINGAVKQVNELCSQARGQAILQQKTVELRIHPGDGSFEIAEASVGNASAIGRLESLNVEGKEWRMGDRHATSGGSDSKSKRLPDGIRIEALLVNGNEDATDLESASVRFRRDGTCDEMIIVLTSDKGEARKIWLDVVTGMTDWESDPSKFINRR